MPDATGATADVTVEICALPCLVLRDGAGGSKVISTATASVDSDGQEEFEVPLASLLPR